MSISEIEIPKSNPGCFYQHPKNSSKIMEKAFSIYETLLDTYRSMTLDHTQSEKRAPLCNRCYNFK